jgi:hypothetical protein
MLEPMPEPEMIVCAAAAAAACAEARICDAVGVLVVLLVPVVLPVLPVEPTLEVIRVPFSKIFQLHRWHAEVPGRLRFDADKP